jgi:hypothetical protein
LAFVKTAVTFQEKCVRLFPVVFILLSLAACSDPLANVGRLGDVTVADEPVAAALPTEDEVAREGFFGPDAATGDVPAGVAPPAAELPRGFLRGLIQRAANADPAEAIAADVAQNLSLGAEADGSETAQAAEAPVVLAALAPEVAPDPAAQPRRGLGLFGNRTNTAGMAAPKPRTGPDARDVTYGTVLPFGEIARVCDAKGKSLGKKIDSLGRRGFTLYDSNAGVRDKRTFYITGFGDDCPRQFTAANALFGAPSFYEVIRFGPTGQHLPMGATDAAYDKVKSSVCRVGKKKPCGNQIGKLDNELAFVSTYEFSEHNNAWTEYLIHDGEVLARATKSN